jgi:hypothetical protein
MASLQSGYPGGSRCGDWLGFGGLGLWASRNLRRGQLAGAAVSLCRLCLDTHGTRPKRHPAGPDGPRTSWLTDPDSYRIELVQWPAGHCDGITAADFGYNRARASAVVTIPVRPALRARST